MASIINDYRDTVLAAIRTAIPEFREVKAHGGMFTADQIKRFSMKAPACRVAFLGIPRENALPTGELNGPATFCAYVIAQDKPGKESWDVATELCEALAGLINGNNFGFARSNPADVLEIDNLYAMQEEKVGYTLMAVSWRQEIRFGPNTYATDEAATNAASGDIDMTNLETLISLGVVGPGDEGAP